MSNVNQIAVKYAASLAEVLIAPPQVEVQGDIIIIGGGAMKLVGYGSDWGLQVTEYGVLGGLPNVGELSFNDIGAAFDKVMSLWVSDQIKEHLEAAADFAALLGR